MIGRKQARQAKQETRRRILDAAADLYTERGFAAVSARDVSDAAGLTTRTLRRHFHDDAELFAEAVAERARSEVASRLGVSLSTVRRLERRGLASLRALADRIDPFADGPLAG